jgi:hypothetical protein
MWKFPLEHFSLMYISVEGPQPTMTKLFTTQFLFFLFQVAVESEFLGLRLLVLFLGVTAE